MKREEIQGENGRRKKDSEKCFGLADREIRKKKGNRKFRTGGGRKNEGRGGKASKTSASHANGAQQSK